ncbi:hypothetical protein HF086_009091 [Spodoptera exigua]|uniref:Uncharacterized protein n=1 Tax=Spodoptera exigua TaxID=7107 RepID=A0A922SB19_SPOEX|nr:hypothetical protein HF086_009091 [Spodoptera exigua]
MQKKIVLIWILIFVETSLEDNFKKGWLPFDLVEEPEPFTPDDFNEIPKIEGPGICHTSNMDCLTKLKYIFLCTLIYFRLPCNQMNMLFFGTLI